MSFSISESKIEELLKSSNKGYEVSTSIVELACQNYAPYYAVSGATYIAPGLVTEETRQHFVALRRKIEESGTALKSEYELDREIEEMRGRKNS